MGRDRIREHERGRRHARSGPPRARWKSGVLFAAILGWLPTPEEYLEYAKNIDSMADDIYRYLNFDQMSEFQKSAEDGARIAAVEIQEVSV